MTKPLCLYCSPSEQHTAISPLSDSGSQDLVFAPTLTLATRYPSCNSRWAAAEGGRVWCEDKKKVPRKFAPENVHGAGIREQGEESSQPKSGAAKQAAEAARGGSGVGGEAEASRDAAKVCGVWRVGRG